MISKKSIISLGITFLLLFPTTVFAQEISKNKFPANTGLVTDAANILTENTKNSLTQKLQTLKENKKVELAVVTVTTLHDYPIEDYTLQLGRFWGVGQKETDSGVVFLIAPNEREVRIEVGYGIEGTLTDAQSFQIINQLLPYFKEGNYNQGIEFATNQIITTITTGYLAPDTNSKSSTNPDTIFNLLIFGIFGLIWLAGILGRSKSIWAGAIIGAIGGTAIGLYLNIIYLFIGGTLLGLLFDYIVSKNYASNKKTPWWAGGKDNWWDGPRSGGGGGWSSGGGGFGGGSFGGGGSSGRW